ncbi:MAG: hypothetical protein ABIN36_17140 [Ferruginibacter sp.]
MEQVTKYFNAEKNESLLFIIVGLAAIIFSSYCLIKTRQPFFNGMAYSLIAIGVIQLTVGISVYVRSPKDIARVGELIQKDTAKIQTQEIPRMNVVMKNFALYKWIEIALIIAGLIMFFYFQPRTVWRGAGLGLFIQAGFMLLLDIFAESRGNVYLDYLHNLK